jgi:tRNA-Thr(GGU) m(6)t(6)A37 methyltransferase TsaA
MFKPCHSSVVQDHPLRTAPVSNPPRMTINFQAIGVVHNNVQQGLDEQWGEVVSEIRLRADLADGLNEIEQFSHVVVMFYMHDARFDADTHLVRRPRDRADMPLLGIFAQRAKHRPNPIGATTVQVVKVADGSLFVRGLDAIDGTPVLDIKPHTPIFDAPSQPRVPEWLERLMLGYF